MASKNINLPVYTYEFMPASEETDGLFESAEEVKERNMHVMARKQDLMQDFLEMIAKGELVPAMNDKQYRCKVLYNKNRIVIFKMEHLKDETYDWDFGTATHPIGPNCHVIVDNRANMQHIAIEPKQKAFSSTNVVKNILNETFKPLFKQHGLLFDIKAQYQPSEFWEYVDAEQMYGIKEVRFYFPYPNLPAISDKYGEFMKQVGLDYTCMPGLILYAPDDLDMKLSKNDKGLQFYLEAAGESGIPIAVQSKRKGSRLHLVGRSSSQRWQLDRAVLDSIDPNPSNAHSHQMELEFMEQEKREATEERIIEFVNNGRFAAALKSE